jgi:RHS repeat-associated protein
MTMRTLRYFLLACLFFLFFAALSFAQTANVDNTTSTPTEGVGHDYIHLLSETVNPANGSVSLRIELPIPNGRGIGMPFAISYSSNSVNHWVPGYYPYFGTVHWAANTGNLSQGGWSYTVPAVSSINTNPTEGDYPNFWTCYVYSDYIFHDPSGGTHALELGTSVSPGSYCAEYPVVSGGDSQFLGVLPWPHPGLTDTNPHEAPLSVYSADGTVYQFNTSVGEGNGNTENLALPDYIEDRNGNRIVTSSSGSGSGFHFSFTDTLGRTLISSNGFGPTGSTNTITVGGLTYQITWKTATINFSTPSQAVYPNSAKAASCQSIPKAVNTPTVISKITLPNQKAYTFYYGADVTPHGAYTNPYGLLSEIDYPSGAWVKYTWKLSDTMNELADYPGLVLAAADVCTTSEAASCPEPVADGCLYLYQTPVVASRQVFSGSPVSTLSQDFTYSTTWASSASWPPVWTQKSTNLTTRDNVLGTSSLTSYSYTSLPGPVPPYSQTLITPQIPVENTISYYDWSSKLLKTVTKTWYDQYDLKSEQTVLDPNSTTPANSLVKYFYVGANWFPQLQKKDDYDYSGALARETITNYQSFSGTPGIIADKPCQTIVYGVVNGVSTRAAETDYFYDGMTGTTPCGTDAGQALSGTGIYTDHDETYFGNTLKTPRGNATTVVKQCFQDSAQGSAACSQGNSTTTYKFDETGQVTSSTDARGNTTTYSYADNYTILSGGTNVSYTPSGNTNANLTKTTDALGHSKYFQYDFYNGQPTSSTDENGLTTTYIYNDPFSRPTLVNNPDGGQTTVAYNDTAPNPTVTTTKKINATTTATSVSVMDGIGHVIEKQLTSDPQGVVYSDTVYDGMGHVWKESNPYRNSDPTSSPGTTAHIVDALGRSLQVVKPDGSVINTEYSGNSTTVTDETGRMRLSYSDALGRLIEVEEPGGAGAAIPTAGRATITINGYEQTWTGNPCQGYAGAPACPQTIPDTGTINVTVNGCWIPGGYGSGSTAQQIASYIASALNTNCSYFLTASANGATVTITATDPGAGSNYLITTSVTWYTTYFANPSFTASASNFTGGTDGSMGSTPLVTRYSYDALNNLTCAVQQGTDATAFTTCAAAPAAWRPRSFSYDSLSHLISSYNPEVGTIGYTYDANGNLASKTDARNITTTYSYEALNRLTSRKYSNGDPANTIAYDETNCLGLPTCQNIGYRTSMTDAAGTEAWAYQVDKTNLRSLHQNKRTTLGVTKTSTYTMDLAGNLAQLAYPSGRIVNYNYNAANRPIAVLDSANGTLGQTVPSNNITYATAPATPLSGCIGGAVCYTPQGSVYSASLGKTGTFAGVNINASFNNRLQPVEIKASSAAGNALDITYNFVDPVTSHNSGHVYGIANNLNSARSQSFTYDLLNRISSAGTTATSGTYAWGYQYAYDNWGNLLAQSGWTPTYNGAVQTVTSAVNADNYNHLYGFTYDPSGNTQSDGSYAYTWNGESEMKTAAGVTYTYDGDGRRASKSGAVSKLYWYGSGGEILAETDGSGNTTEYIFFGGKRVAMLPAGSTPLYYVEDFLGSSRVMTTNTGAVCYDADFTPYGGERPYINTCAPQNAYKFEGKERDAETQNDDFGARYYTWRFGRWLSADWSAMPVAVPYANLTNPQTLNLYAMVADDPESFADLDGHGSCGTGTDPTCARAVETDKTLSKKKDKPKPKPIDPPKVRIRVPGTTITVTATITGLSQSQRLFIMLAFGGHHGVPQALFRFLEDTHPNAYRWLNRWVTGPLDGPHYYDAAHREYSKAIEKLLKLDTPEGQADVANDVMRAGQKILDSDNPAIKGFLDNMTTADGMTGREALGRALAGDGEALGQFGLGAVGEVVEGAAELE